MDEYVHYLDCGDGFSGAHAGWGKSRLTVVCMENNIIINK